MVECLSSRMPKPSERWFELLLPHSTHSLSMIRARVSDCGGDPMPECVAALGQRTAVELMSFALTASLALSVPLCP